MKVVKVKYFEPAQRRLPECPERLDSPFNHPDRYRIATCFLRRNGKVQLEGAEGEFTFVDGKCSDFLGYYEAEIVEEVEEHRWREPDIFLPAN